MGTDLVDIARFERALERTPGLRSRLFTPAESGLSTPSLAARFAAKEALAKALDSPGGLSWQDAEVVGEPGARPSFVCSGTVAAVMEGRGVTGVHLSLSHDGGFAIAFVMLEGRWFP